MGRRKLAPYFDEIPPASAAFNAMKRAESRALCAVSKDTWSTDRIRARREAIADIKCVRKLLSKDGNPAFDLKAVVQQVFQMAIDRAAKAKPKRTKTKTKFEMKRPYGQPLPPVGPKHIARTFKLPKDVVTPISGKEDIDKRYRTYRNPLNPTTIQCRLGREPKPLNPASRQRNKRCGYGSGGHHEESELVSKLETTVLEDGESAVNAIPGSTRLPASYTINCLAADLQVSAFSESDKLNCERRDAASSPT